MFGETDNVWVAGCRPLSPHWHSSIVVTRGPTRFASLWAGLVMGQESEGQQSASLHLPPALPSWLFLQPLLSVANLQPQAATVCENQALIDQVRTMLVTPRSDDSLPSHSHITSKTCDNRNIRLQPEIP